MTEHNMHIVPCAETQAIWAYECSICGKRGYSNDNPKEAIDDLKRQPCKVAEEIGAYRYVKPRAFYRPDWMPGLPGVFSIFGSSLGMEIPASKVWRNCDGLVMIIGFGIMSQEDFDDSFEKCEPLENAYKE